MVWFGALASGVKKFGEEAKAKDVSVAAEAKANAEAFIEKNEEYEDTITMNKNKLRAEAESLQALVGSNVGKIRTVMNAYGNVDVIKKLEQDFINYQSKNMVEQKEGKFKNLKEYINGKLKSNGIVSDEAAEVAEDEAAIAGETFDIKKAQKKAKAQGVSLDTYLQSQAIKMTDKPSFNLDARAAKLVEESKMGLLGKTLTLDEAKTMIMDQSKQGISPVGPEAEDLGETGFTFDRDIGLTAAEQIKLKALQEQIDPKIDIAKMTTQENKYINMLPDDLKVTKVGNDGTQKITIKELPEAKSAMLKILTDEINSKRFSKYDKESQKILLALKEKYEKPVAKKTEENKEKEPKKPSVDKIKELQKQGKTNEEIARLISSAKNSKMSYEQSLEYVKKNLIPDNIATQ